MNSVAGRIIYISPYYKPSVASGANRRFDEIGQRFMQDLGNNFVLVVSRGARPEWASTMKNIFEVNYGFNHWTKFRALREIARILDSQPPSVVILESIPIPFQALKRHIHIQVAYDFRYFYPFSKSALYRLVFSQYLKSQWRHSEIIVTCSDFSIDELERHIGFPRDQVIKSFFGINEKIYDVPHLPTKKKEYDIIYVGHFDGHKNHAALIDALARLDRSLQVLFIGVDNGLLVSLKRRAVDHGLTNITWMTVRNEKKVWEYYTKSRAFISPSLYEGFGMPTIEALALGLPVALSDIKVFHEVAKDLALYFDPRDPVDIAEKVRSLLKNQTPLDPAVVRKHLEPYLWGNIYRKFVEELNARLGIRAPFGPYRSVGEK